MVICWHVYASQWNVGRSCIHNKHLLDILSLRQDFVFFFAYLCVFSFFLSVLSWYTEIVPLKLSVFSAKLWHTSGEHWWCVSALSSVGWRLTDQDYDITNTRESWGQDKTKTYGNGDKTNTVHIQEKSQQNTHDHCIFFLFSLCSYFEPLLEGKPKICCTSEKLELERSPLLNTLSNGAEDARTSHCFYQKTSASSVSASCVASRFLLTCAQMHVSWFVLQFYEPFNKKVKVLLEVNPKMTSPFWLRSPLEYLHDPSFQPRQSMCLKSTS